MKPRGERLIAHLNQLFHTRRRGLVVASACLPILVGQTVAQTPYINAVVIDVAPARYVATEHVYANNGPCQLVSMKVKVALRGQWGNKRTAWENAEGAEEGQL